MSLDEITLVVLPPVGVPCERSDTEWKLVFDGLGLELPSDYREFIDSYGAGLLASFVRVFSPFYDDDRWTLETLCKVICQDYRDREGGVYAAPYPLYPESPGLLPWGDDENGNTYFWLTKGHPSEWPTVILEARGSDSEQFDLPMTSFLAQGLRGDLAVDMWPEGYPSAAGMNFKPF